MPQSPLSLGGISAIQPIVQMKTRGLQAPVTRTRPEEEGDRGLQPDFKLCPRARRVVDTGMP